MPSRPGEKPGERENEMLKVRLIRYRIIEKHMALVKAGEMETASVLFSLLRTGRVALGLSDADCRAEIFLEIIGLQPCYSGRYSVATFRMPEK